MKELISDLRKSRNCPYTSFLEARHIINFYKDSTIEALVETIVDEECCFYEKYDDMRDMLLDQVKDIMWEMESKPYQSNDNSIKFLLEQLDLFKDYGQRLKWLADIKSRLIQINGDDENGKRNERKILEDSFRASA